MYVSEKIKDFARACEIGKWKSNYILNNMANLEYQFVITPNNHDN